MEFASLFFSLKYPSAMGLPPPRPPPRSPYINPRRLIRTLAQFDNG